ncbi:MAG: IclR family transcriptional regulator C-terminal domain-containing protein [Rhodospirillaceae bacterium]
MAKKPLDPHPSWNPLESSEAAKANKNRVNSLLKGLRVIEVLNTYQCLNTNAVAKLIGATRGTTYRLLETLREGGYVGRDESSGIYWLEPTVLGLSEGMSQEKWVWKTAVPIMENLDNTETWPLSLVTPHGATMIVRATTDAQSPTSLHYMTIGARMPMLTTAGGLVYLAFCEEKDRDFLIELARKSMRDNQETSLPSGAMLKNQMAHIRKEGYAIHDGGHRITALAVPVFSKSRVFAVLALRYFSSAMSFKQGVDRYLPTLKEAARSIGLEFDALES